MKPEKLEQWFSDFGQTKIKRLQVLGKLYGKFGQPFDLDEVGRTCSINELNRMIREARSWKVAWD